jgi:GT2 family glycosyltransferase
MAASLVPGDNVSGPHPGIAVVLVNWRAAAMTLRAVDLAFAQSRPPDHVFVVDNGSADGSAERLACGLAAHAGRATLIVNDRNKGFGGGCNPAIEAALTAGYVYLWLLNNDAEPEPDCLAALLRAAEAASEPVGAVGSLLLDPTGRQAPHFGSWMRAASLTCGGVARPADLDHRYAWCTAASLLLNAQAIKKIGGFDEGFFMYWEDADLNMRLREGGYRLLCAEDARVAHGAGTSSASIPVQRYLWHFDSQRRFLHKHHRHPRVAVPLLRAKFLLKALYDGDGLRFRALISRLRGVKGNPE